MCTCTHISMSLTDLSREITIYTGILLVLTGFIGNLMNIYIFSKVQSYRKSSSAFYICISSIFNIGYIGINLLSRIVSIAFSFDLTQISVVWCKTRQFCLLTLSLVTLTCSCLSTIDQYFVTSHKVSLRRFSNLKWSHRIVILVVILSSIHGIFLILYSNILANNCVITNSIFNIYVRIFILVILCIVPVIVMILFGYLAFQNLQRTQFLSRQFADRQMTKMILFQVILITCSITPYAIYIIYSLITSQMIKHANQLNNEAFVSTIINLFPYFYYSVSLFSKKKTM